MTKRLLLLLIFVFALFTGVINAQEDDLTEDDLENIEFVATAFANMAELESMTSAGTQLVDQTIEAQGQEVIQVIEQDVTSDIILGDDPAFSSTVIQTLNTQIGLQSLEVEMTMDMISLENNVWVRVRDASREVAAQFPSGWINVAQNPNRIPGMELLNIEQMLQTTNSALNYPITADAISRITELESEERDEQNLRVFEIELDWEGFIESDEFELIRDMFNPGATPVNVDAMMEQMFNGAVISMVVYIGEDDNLVYQVDQTMNIDAEIENMLPGVRIIDMRQDMTGSFTYANFNNVAEITAPTSQ